MPMNPRVILVSLAVLSASLHAAAPSQAGDVTKGLIRGGIGVAGVELGMTEAQVKAQLGEPEHVNKSPTGKPLYMSFHSSQNFGVYFDEATGRVRQLIVAVQSKEICTAFGVCLYREGDLPKLKKHYGKKMIRFVDSDGSVTYRRLVPMKPRNVLVEYTPVEEKNGVVQVAMFYWDGKITDSSFD